MGVQATSEPMYIRLLRPPLVLKFGFQLQVVAENKMTFQTFHSGNHTSDATLFLRCLLYLYLPFWFGTLLLFPVESMRPMTQSAHQATRSAQVLCCGPSGGPGGSAYPIQAGFDQIPSKVGPTGTQAITCRSPSLGGWFHH